MTGHFTKEKNTHTHTHTNTHSLTHTATHKKLNDPEVEKESTEDEKEGTDK